MVLMVLINSATFCLRTVVAIYTAFISCNDDDNNNDNSDDDG